MTEEFSIGHRVVGVGHPTYIIAELSGNHHHDFSRAVALIEAAADAGVDAVKLQTYTADTLTLDVRTDIFAIGGGTLWDGRTLHDLYTEASTPWDWQPRLKVIAEGLGLQLFSSPFDASAVEFLEAMDVPAYKIASPELVDLGLIQAVAATGKPIIMSCGMATIEEITDAVGAAAGASGIGLLRCNSSYPAEVGEMDLVTIAEMSTRWACPVGLSDHTLSPVTAVVAVALGACIIEKHLTLSRADPGPDSAFSLEPHEFATLVRDVRETEAALGSVRFGPSEHERATLPFRRSLFVTEDMSEGEIFTDQNTRSIRPANGLAPKYLPVVLGHRAAKTITRGTPLTWDLISDSAS
jgi:pseudaminic acid synthase